MRREGYAERIRTSQIESLGSVLTGAFYNNPCAAFIVPEPEQRRGALSWFFNSVAIRASRLCGEIYTTPSVKGGALWIRPGVNLTIRQAVKAELSSLPLRLDRPSIIRWINVVEYLEAARQTLTDKDHWYLLAIGTAPSPASTAIRRTLMAPVLNEADWDLRPCYVETFEEGDLPFYEQRGFHISAAGQIPEGGPGFWSLIRPPRLPEPVMTGKSTAKRPQEAVQGALSYCIS